MNLNLPSPSVTWNLKIIVSKRNLLASTGWFFQVNHVKLLEGRFKFKDFFLKKWLERRPGQSQNFVKLGLYVLTLKAQTSTFLFPVYFSQYSLSKRLDRNLRTSIVFKNEEYHHTTHWTLISLYLVRFGSHFWHCSSWWTMISRWSVRWFLPSQALQNLYTNALGICNRSRHKPRKKWW